MSNEERRSSYQSLRTTFVEDLSPQGPLVAFDVALGTVRQGTRALSRALAVDFLGAGEAADALNRALAFATRAATVMGLSANGEAARQLADVQAIAESILALAPGPSILALAPGPSIGHEIALFRMRLGSLQRALTRLRTAVETADDDVTTIAHVLGLKAESLPRALNDASGDAQLIIDELAAISAASRREAPRPQLEAAQRKFREVALRRQLDAALFKRAKNAVRNTLTRAMLANVAMMITFAIDSGGRKAIADQGEEHS
jgi:hypothetical protein